MCKDNFFLQKRGEAVDEGAGGRPVEVQAEAGERTTGNASFLK